MNLLEVRYNPDQMRRVKAALAAVPRQMPVIMSRAVNRTATTARADAARRIKARTGLPVGRIKARIGQTKATRSFWQSTLSISGRRIGLIDFAARQTKLGVTYKLGDGGRQLREHAFIAEMTSGHRGVFILSRWITGRPSSPRTRWGQPELPIMELRGPSLGMVLESAPETLKAAQTAAAKTLEKNIDSQVALALAKRRAV